MAQWIKVKHSEAIRDQSRRSILKPSAAEQNMTFYFKFVDGTTEERMRDVVRRIRKIRGVFGIARMFPNHKHPRMRTMCRIESDDRTRMNKAVEIIGKMDDIEYADAPCGGQKKEAA